MPVGRLPLSLTEAVWSGTFRGPLGLQRVAARKGKGEKEGHARRLS